jgi:hypothetical protein
MEDCLKYTNSDTESQLDHVEKVRQAAVQAGKENPISASDVFSTLKWFVIHECPENAT